MTKPSSGRISREMIVSAALHVAAHGPGRAPEPVTGATLGRVLNVDRSAVWRHFADKDELLRAVGNALLAGVVATASAVAEPRDRMRTLYRETIAEFDRHPHLATQLMTSPFTGPSGRDFLELAFDALGAAGVHGEQAAILNRTFFDLTISYAAMLAASAVRPPEARAREDTLIRGDLMSLDTCSYPHLAALGSSVATLDQDRVTDHIFEWFWFAVDRARTEIAHA